MGSVGLLGGSLAVFIALPEAQHAVSGFFTNLKQPVATLLTGVMAVSAVILSQVMFDIRQRKDHAHILEMEQKKYAIKQHEFFLEEKKGCFNLITESKENINLIKSQILKITLISFDTDTDISEQIAFKEIQIESDNLAAKCHSTFSLLEIKVQRCKIKYEHDKSNPAPYYSRYTELNRIRKSLLDSISSDNTKIDITPLQKTCDNLFIALFELEVDLQNQKDDENINEILKLKS